MKDTAVGELAPDPFPQLANGTGPNRTCAQWKITSADALVNKNHYRSGFYKLLFIIMRNFIQRFNNYCYMTPINDLL